MVVGFGHRTVLISQALELNTTCKNGLIQWITYYIKDLHWFPQSSDSLLSIYSKFLLLLDVLGHSSDEQVGVKVEAVSTARTLAFDVWLIVHTEHGVTPIASHYQLMPAALLDQYVADDSAGA